jgi:hypothetical protein
LQPCLKVYDALEWVTAIHHKRGSLPHSFAVFDGRGEMRRQAASCAPLALGPNYRGAAKPHTSLAAKRTASAID